MSTDGATHTAAAIELDMRSLLRAKKARLSDASKETASDYPSLVSQISGQSVYEVDHLIAGLQGVREKLGNDGDRLHREIVQYAAFSQFRAGNSLGTSPPAMARRSLPQPVFGTNGRTARPASG
jgi:hypothetical protein